MCYVVGVNRVGGDNNNLEYNGHSKTYNCYGEPISKQTKEEEFVELVCLDKNHISQVRNQLNFLNDKDEFKLQL